jgi:hypothetical protein
VPGECKEQVGRSPLSSGRLEAQLAVPLCLVEKASDLFRQVRRCGLATAGGFQEAQGAPGFGGHAFLVEGQGEIEGEEMRLLAPAEVEEHGGFIRAGDGGDVLQPLVPKAVPDLPEDPGRIRVLAAPRQELAFHPSDAEKTLRIIREDLAKIALEQQPSGLGQLAGIDEGIQQIVIRGGDKLGVLRDVQK